MLPSRRFGLFLPSIAVALVLFSGNFATAQVKPPASQIIKMGVLDITRVIRTAKMTLDVARQKDKLRGEFRSEIKADEEALRKANEELERQRVILAPEALEQERRKFRQKGVELQRKVQAKNQSFAQITRVTDQAIRKELQKAVDELVKSQGFTLILQRRNIFYGANFLDVTPLVIKILDKNVSSYKIPKNIKVVAPKTKK